MAIFNEILVGRFNRGLQKYFGIKGTAPIRQVAGEIQPSHPLFSGCENRFLEGWERFAIVGLQAGVAAQVSNVRLRNPTGSNVIAVIEKLSVSVGAADTAQIFLAATSSDFATILATNNRLDPRTRSRSTLIASRGTGSGGLAATIHQQDQAALITNDVIFSDDQELTLLPGDAIEVDTTLPNERLQVTLWWRERILEESERQ